MSDTIRDDEANEPEPQRRGLGDPPQSEPAGARSRGRPPGAPNKIQRVKVERTAADVRPVDFNQDDRAAPIRDEWVDEHGRPIVRQSRESRERNQFDLNPKKTQRGYAYEWKTSTVLNQPMGAQYTAEYRGGGWMPEKAKDWPEFAEPGAPADGPVVFQGQILVKRPKHMDLEAKQEDYNYAVAQQRHRMAQAKVGRVDDGISGMRGVQIVESQLTVEGEVGR